VSNGSQIIVAQEARQVAAQAKCLDHGIESSRPGQISILAVRK
jgi:hypothetical protein